MANIVFYCTKTLLYVSIPLIVVVAGYSFAWAQASQQISVSAVVPEKPPFEEPDTIVVFSGIAYPSSTVTISQDGSVISLITTNSQAQFQVEAIVDPDTYTFRIAGIDQQGIEGKVSNFTLTLSEGTTTTISGIFLGPTIMIDDPEIGVGESATLSGTTAPNSEVNLTFTSTGASAAAAGETRTAVHIANADTNGRWLQVVAADDLVADVYEAKAQAVEPVNSAVSEFSKTVQFTVFGGEPDQCDGASPGDINCDGNVDLVDFSILLFYWNQTDPANERADINSDGLVSIIDFSIMLYYWTG